MSLCVLHAFCICSPTYTGINPFSNFFFLVNKTWPAGENIEDGGQRVKNIYPDVSRDLE